MIFWDMFYLCPFLSSQRFTVLSIFCNKVPIFLIFRFFVRTWFCLSQLLNASLMNCVYNRIVLFISDGSWFAFLNSKLYQAFDYFKWSEDSAIRIGKAASNPLMFNHLNNNPSKRESQRCRGMNWS